MIRDTNYLVQRLSGFSFYSALIKIALGLVFLDSANTFAVNPISYASMAMLANEDVWGWFLLTVGVFHVFSIFSDRLVYRIPAQIISVGVWLFIAVQFLVSNPIGTGKITYGIT